METTYKLPWHNIKKGSLIQFTGDAAIYRILTMASDGTVELMPYKNFSMYDEIEYYGTDTNVSDLISNSNRTKRYYIYTKKLSETSGMSSFDNSLYNLPFNNYLQNVAVNQTVWMLDDIPLQSANVSFLCPEGRGTFAKRFYKTSMQINNPTLHRWRPLALDDLVDYLGTAPTLEEFVKFWPKLSYGMSNLSSQKMILYDEYGGYNEYRSGYIYADNYDPGYSVLQTSSFLRGDYASFRFIPVFKVNLKDLLDAHITFKGVQE